MSELVYLQTTRGTETQIWHGPPFLGELMLQRNALGNFMFPSLGGDRVVKRVPIKDSEAALGIDKLKELYPLA